MLMPRERLPAANQNRTQGHVRSGSADFNPIDRYDLAQRDRLNTNPDGSVDLYIQADSPGKDREANWLPAPKGKFQLVMRIYAPKKTPPSILDGSWTPPPVKKVQ